MRRTIILVAITALVCSAASATASSLINGSRIKAHTITAKQIKRHTLTGAEIKAHSLPVSTLKGSVAGSQGPKGNDGAQGPPGTGVISEISGSVTLPAVQSPTIVPISLSGNAFSNRSVASVAGTAEFPTGLPCAGAISVGTIVLLYVDGTRQSFLDAGVIAAEPGYQSFALSVPPGSHTITAEGRASCSNGAVPMTVRMTVLGRP
jgi:hypothetical protein